MIENALFVVAVGLPLTIIATWRALPLLVVASIADLALRRRLAARHHATLWTIVAIRLLLPFSLPVPWSLHGPIDGAVFAALQATREPSPPRPIETQPTPAPKPNEAAQGVQSFPPRAQFDAGAAPKPTPPDVGWDYYLAVTLGCVWALVAGGLLLRGAIAYRRFARKLRDGRELTDARLLEPLTRECAALGVRAPRTIETSEVSAPAAFGLFHPMLCLPVGAVESLPPRELRWIVRHELAHLRRRDAWLAALASIVAALHWWNPVAWLVVARLRAHMEAAADDLALEGASKDDAIAYGRLLVEFAERPTWNPASPAIGLLAFVARRRLRGRIARLTDARPAARFWKTSLAVAATASLAIVGLTDASEMWGLEPHRPTLKPHFPLSNDLGIAGLDSHGPTSPREYDAAEALKRLEDESSETGADTLLATAKLGFPSERAIRLDGQTLIAEVTEIEHRELAARLDAWKRTGLRQIVVESRFLQPDMAKIAPIEWHQVPVDRMGDGSILFIATKITSPQLFQLLQDMQDDVRSNVLQAPKSTHFNGQSIAYSNLHRTPFVTNVQLQPDGALQPMIEVFDEGFRLDVRPTAIDDETIELAVELRVSRIGEVKEIDLPFKLPQDRDETVTVQAPSVASSTARCTVRLRPEEHLLIATPHVRSDETSEAVRSTTFFALSPHFLAYEAER